MSNITTSNTTHNIIDIPTGYTFEKLDKTRITKEQYKDWYDYESTSKESLLVSVCIMSIVVLAVSFIVTSNLI